MQADINGSSQVHVIKGKIQLFAGLGIATKTGQLVTENRAVQYDANTGRVKEIQIQAQAFARHINSKLSYVWWGQRSIDLADIVGGGNGLGTGRLEVGIHVLTGAPVANRFDDIPVLTGALEDGQFDYTCIGRGEYVPVPQNPFVDGVFVPDGRNQEVTVSSAGHVFAECPETNNLSYTPIMNVRPVNSLPPLLLEERSGAGPCSLIYLNSNAGITFDLQALRIRYPETGNMRFLADAFLWSYTSDAGSVDIWVLVDGEVRFCQKKMTEPGKLCPVKVDLLPSDRFLTLIATDSEGKDIQETI